MQVWGQQHGNSAHSKRCEEMLSHVPGWGGVRGEGIDDLPLKATE